MNEISLSPGFKIQSIWERRTDQLLAKKTTLFVSVLDVVRQKSSYLRNDTFLVLLVFSYSVEGQTPGAFEVLSHLESSTQFTAFQP